MLYVNYISIFFKKDISNKKDFPNKNQSQILISLINIQRYKRDNNLYALERYSMSKRKEAKKKKKTGTKNQHIYTALINNQ